MSQTAGFSASKSQSGPELTWADLHRFDVETGAVSVLTLLDNLPWLRKGPDWTAWRAFLCALYGLPMTEQERLVYEVCTGRADPPTKPAREAYVVAGRRARKSAIASLVAVHRAAFYDYGPSMAAGERAIIPVLSDRRANADQIMRFVREILSGPGLRELVEGEPRGDRVQLVTRVDIEVRAASLSAGRSRSSPCAVLDEAAFFPRDDSATPDEEIVRGLLPSMATFPEPLLLVLSSPYVRRGILWAAYRDHYGVEGDPILVWQAPTLRMHNTPQLRVVVADAVREDAVGASAEYLAQFRDDISGAFSELVLRECTDEGVTSRDPVPGLHYVAWVDPSGGSVDSFGLAIAHWDGARSVLDYIGEWRAPHSPKTVVREVSMVLRRYGLHSVEGDRYAGEWPAERFLEGIHDATCPRDVDDHAACKCTRWTVAYTVSDLVRDDIYGQLIPLANERRMRILDVARLRSQLASLERSGARGGRDKIDHPPNSHDDVAVCAAGALVRAHSLRVAPRVVKPEPRNNVELHVQQIHERVARMLKAGTKRGGDEPRGGSMP